jgi:hypothetical protein
LLCRLKPVDVDRSKEGKEEGPMESCAPGNLKLSLDRWQECRWHLHQMEGSLPCRHDPALARIKRFSQQEFFLSVDGIGLEEEERKWRERRA